MLRRIFSRADRDQGNARAEAEKWMTEVEGLFSVAANTKVDLSERMSALNTAARLGWSLSDFADRLPATDQSKDVWKEQANEVRRQVKMLTDRMCPAESAEQKQSPNKLKRHSTASSFDLFSGMKLERPSVNGLHRQGSAQLEASNPTEAGSSRPPLDEDFFTDLVPDRPAAPTVTEKTSDAFNNPACRASYLYTHAEASFPETHPSPIDDKTMHMMEKPQQGITKIKKTHLGYGRSGKGMSRSASDFLVEFDPAASPIGEPVASDITRPDMNAAITISEAQPLNFERDVSGPSSAQRDFLDAPVEWEAGSLMQKANTVRQETEDTARSLEESEKKIVADVISHLQDIQESFNSDESDETNKSVSSLDQQLKAAVHAEQALLEQMIENLSIATEALTGIREEHTNKAGEVEEQLAKEAAVAEEHMQRVFLTVEELRSKTETAQAAYEQTKKEVEEQNHQISVARESQLSELQESKDKLIAEIDELRALLQQKEIALAAVEEQIKPLSEEIQTVPVLPDDTQLKSDLRRLQSLEEKLLRRTEEMERTKEKKEELREQSESEKERLEMTLSQFTEKLKATEKKAEVLQILESNLRKLDAILDASSEEFSAKRAQAKRRKELREKLDSQKADLDEQIGMVSADIQSKEDELHKILEEKRAALNAKEYNEAARLAASIKQITFDLSELESQRLTACQAIESVQQKIKDADQATSSLPEASMDTAEKEWHRSHYRRLFLFDQMLHQLSDDKAATTRLSDALKSLEEQHGWKPEIDCGDLINAFSSIRDNV